MKNNNTFDLIVMGRPAEQCSPHLRPWQGVACYFWKKNFIRYQIGESLWPSIRGIGELLAWSKAKEADLS
jgi:hypothetical protein